MRWIALAAALALVLAGCSSSPDDDAGTTAPVPTTGDDPATSGPTPTPSPAPSTPSGGSSSGSSGPRFSVGDTWTHAATGAETTIVRTIEAIEATTAAGGTFDAYRIAATTTAAVAGMSLESTATTWTRTSDHALLRSATTSSVAGFDAASTSTAESPCQQWPWPLTTGASWSGQCTLHTD